MLTCKRKSAGMRAEKGQCLSFLNFRVPRIKVEGGQPYLFNGDRLSEVARLIDVASPAHGDVIGQKLKRDDFEDRRKKFGGSRNFDNVVSGIAGQLVSFGYDGDYDSVPRFHFLQVRDCLFVADHRSRIGFVTRGDNDDG